MSRFEEAASPPPAAAAAAAAAAFVERLNDKPVTELLHI